MEVIKKGRVSDYLKAVGLGILAIVLFYIIQVVAMAGFIFVRTFLNIAIAAGNGITVPALVDDIQSPEFLTSATAVMTAVTALIFGIWYKLKYGRKFRKTHWQSFRQYVLTKKNILVCFLLGICCYFVAVAIANIIGFVSPSVMDMYIESMESVMEGNSVIVFLFVGLLAPIGEECLFRGLILRKYLKWLPVAPAIVMQAIFFGIFHMNIVQGIYVLLIGIVTGYVAYRCKSVLPAIFIHAINNCMPSIFKVIPESISGNSILWAAVGILAIVLLVAVIKYMPGTLMEVPEEVEIKEEAAE